MYHLHPSPKFPSQHLNLGPQPHKPMTRSCQAANNAGSFPQGIGLHMEFLNISARSPWSIPRCLEISWTLLHEISANHWILNLNILCRTWQENAGHGPEHTQTHHRFHYHISPPKKGIMSVNPCHRQDTPGFDQSWALQLPKDRTFRGKGS